MTEAEELGLPQHAFDRQDGGDDLGFYAPPRLVTHIDEDAVAALTSFYRDAIPARRRVLDLMSSWVSHLPGDVVYDAVVGHGMNAEELAVNPRLDRWFLRDLNGQPELPDNDGTYDAVLICVGIQYLQRPLAVLREVRRVLAPGGIVVVSEPIDGCHEGWQVVPKGATLRARHGTATVVEEPDRTRAAA